MPIYAAAALLLILFAAAAFPWLLVIRQRFGHLLAIPATAAGALLLLLVTLVISHALRVNYMTALIVASVIVGGLGVLAARRTPHVFRRPGRYAVALWCPALLGGFIWISTVAAAQFVPGMSRFGWAMNGDALNNLYFADVIVRDNGIPLDQSTYALPLSTSLIATGLGAGSPPSNTAEGLLEHHLEAFTLVWVILLAVICVACGVVCAMLIAPTSTRTVITISALGSLLPLTWFFSGLIIQWGYFNVDVVLPVVLAAWIVYLSSRHHPFFALLCLVVLAILAFASWTPIAILIVGLGITLVIRHAPEFLAMRRRYLIPLIGVIVLSLGVIPFFVDLKSVLSLNGDLSTTGSGYQGFVNLWWAVPPVAVIAVLAALLVRLRTKLPTTSGLVGLLAASAATGALLVYLASGHGELFSAYYPKKFAWILLALLAVILFSFLIGGFAGRVRPRLLSTFGVIALIAAAIVPPGTWPEVIQRQPVVRIAGDFVRHEGEATVHVILSRSTAAHSTVLWQSGDPDEPIINEWLLLTPGGLANGPIKLEPFAKTTYFLYRASGHFTDQGVNAMCSLLPDLKGTPVVVTANAHLRAELHSTCPQVAVTVVVTTKLRGPVPTKTGENWQTDGIEGTYG